jgi:hypothetical protein
MIATSGTSQNWKQKEPCCHFAKKLGLKNFKILKMR